MATPLEGAAAAALRPELERVLEVAAHLLEDAGFVDDLRHPAVLAALDHWTGRRRVAAEEAERRFAEDYRVASVFGKIRNLQEACARAGVGVPLDALVGKDLRAMRAAISGPLASVPKHVAVAGLAAAQTPPAQTRSVQAPSLALAATPSSAASTPPKPESTSDSIRWDEVRRKGLDRLFSVEPQNVVRWWSAQLVCILAIVLRQVMDAHAQTRAEAEQRAVGASSAYEGAAR